MSQKNPSKGRASRRTLGAAAGFLTLAAFAALSPLASSAFQDEQDDGRARSRSSLEQWVAVKRKIEEEKRDWAIKRELMKDRIDVLELEISDQQERIDEAESSIAEADEELGQRDGRKAALDGALGALRARVVALESRTKAIFDRLPDPVKDRVGVLAERFPKDPENTEMKMADRFQTIVGILNAANKFNREVFSTPEVRKLADGRTAEVTTVYLGVGQAYFASADGLSAGHGLPGEDGWVFTAAPGSAAEISQVVRILEKKENPAFVRIPVQVVD